MLSLLEFGQNSRLLALALESAHGVLKAFFLSDRNNRHVSITYPSSRLCVLSDAPYSGMQTRTRSLAHLSPNVNDLDLVGPDSALSDSRPDRGNYFSSPFF